MGMMSVSGMLSTVYALITFAITQPIANKLGKKEWCIAGAGFATVVFAVLFFVPVHNALLFIVINGICFLGASGMQVLVWAMVNDAIDYQELQTGGKRNEGIVYSAYSFFRKLASAVSGSFSSFALGIIGYNAAETVQSAQVVNRIWKTYTGSYVIGYGLAILVLWLVYPLTKKKTEEMLQQLKENREARTAAKED